MCPFLRVLLVKKTEPFAKNRYFPQVSGTLSY
jgi:hypothetical protein